MLIDGSYNFRTKVLRDRAVVVGDDEFHRRRKVGEIAGPDSRVLNFRRAAPGLPPGPGGLDPKSASHPRLGDIIELDVIRPPIFRLHFHRRLLCPLAMLVHDGSHSRASYTTEYITFAVRAACLFPVIQFRRTRPPPPRITNQFTSTRDVSFFFFLFVFASLASRPDMIGDREL